MNRPNWIGQILGGRYRIQELIGQGGMSSVYKALDPNLQRVVAIKLIHPHLSSDPKFTARFEEEARAVARLRHPNIVQVYDFNHDDDLYYMVQEYVPGETVQSLLRHLNKAGTRMQLSDVIKYTTDVCNAIAYAHTFGIIHRDIKPANIMVDTHGSAILMDFGIVKLMEGEGHTTTGAVVGTVMYMPPELIRGERPDPRSDIYSLGVTLFEMLSGRPPFEANSAMTLMMMHQNDPVPDLHHLRPEVPEDLISTAEKALAKTRENRYNSAAEMAAALKKIFDRMTRGQSVASTRIEYPSAPAPGQPLPTVRVGQGASEYGTQVPPAQSPQMTTSGGAKPPSATGPNAVSGNWAGYPNATSAAGMTGTGSSRGSDAKKNNLLTPILAGGGLMVVLLGIVCLLAVGIGLRNQLANGGDGLFGAFAGSTETATPSETAELAPASVEPEASATLAITESPTPIPATPTATEEFFPTPTVPPGIKFVRINDVQLDSLGSYIVEYETFEYTESLPGEHVHFFFNSVPPDQAGMPGRGPWILYGGPRPFNQYKAADRPEDAWQMCAMVANNDHSVQPASGNCFPLPDVTQALALKDTACRFGPGEEYPEVATLKSWDSSPATGLSQDEGWWYINDPEKPDGSCWVPIRTTKLIGNIATLNLVEAPPVPTGGPVGDALYAEITGITLDADNNYVVEYQAHNFTEQLPGTHLHFFFDTTPEEQTGMSGGGARLMFGGPSPFSGYNAADRPADAKELCVLVANPDHTINTGSGNCFPLPDVTAGFVSSQTVCYENPSSTASQAGNLSDGSEILIVGVSTNQDWVYVSSSVDADAACWVPKSNIQLDGDLEGLPVIQTGPAAPPTATAKPKKEPDYGY